MESRSSHTADASSSIDDTDQRSSEELARDGIILGSVGRGKGLQDETHSLAALVALVKEKYGVNYLMVWHTLSGYWAGVSPDAPAMAAFSPQLAFPHQPYPKSMLAMSKAKALEG